MATNLQDCDTVPTCSICLGFLRDPVTLPCQHDFCRPCLQMFAEMSKLPTEANDGVDVDHTGQGASVTLRCPVCRSPAHLGGTETADLPPNITLGDQVRKFRMEKSFQEILKCSVCEEDNSSPAVKSCRNCNLLYCQDCLVGFHPMRGALRRHDVIPVEEFLYLRAAEVTETEGRRPGDSTLPVPCDKHSQPLCIFCVTCEEVICVECLEEHADHTTRSLKSACLKLKAPLKEKTEECTVVKHQIDKLRTEMNALYRDIQGNQAGHGRVIESAFKMATEGLNCWRRDALEKVDERHSRWIRQWKVSMKDLDFKSEAVDRMMETSNRLISSLHVMFLQGYTQHKARLGEHLPDIRTSVRRQEVMKTKLRESVSGDPVIPRRLSLKESILSRPEMKFLQTNNKDLEVVDDGSMVEFVGVCYNQWYEAWADVCLPAGLSYWELEITIRPLENKCFYQCKVGVKHEGSGLSGPGSLTSCLWMGLLYDSGHFRCVSDFGEVKHVYKQWRPHTGSHRLGFCLDTEKPTLIIVDCIQNQVMFTSHVIDVSKPLVAAVDFFHVKQASARLVTGHNTVLPRAIHDILSKGSSIKHAHL